MQLEHLTGDVYACLQEDKGRGWSNSGLINRGGGLVVDTFWDLAHTRRLIEFVSVLVLVIGSKIADYGLKITDFRPPSPDFGLRIEDYGFHPPAPV